MTTMSDDLGPCALRSSTPASKRSTKGPSSICVVRRGKYHPARQGRQLLHNRLVLLLLEGSKASGRRYDPAFQDEPQLEACCYTLRSLTAASCPPPVSRAPFASTSIDSRLSSTYDLCLSRVPSSRSPQMEHQYTISTLLSAH
jgi:hypothetical protein